MDRRTLELTISLLEVLEELLGNGCPCKAMNKIYVREGGLALQRTLATLRQELDKMEA